MGIDQMDDMKDKMKGFMKKFNTSSSSTKFKGQGRVLGSSSSSNPSGHFNSTPNPPKTRLPDPKPVLAPSSRPNLTERETDEKPVDVERETEREIMDREKERETELESAMYTNCLLLGLDPSVIGVGANNATPRVGNFRHSNPKLGEQLLYFILSSLRGPKEFDKVWPIFDSTQSRDFRKVVQSIISELESQGALPRSNSRVSSLATCCGPRFVELLWQLSLHALREVHRRTYAADVASNPLPASLTDVAFSHAATLLPVTKRQAMWSNLAHEMTAEYRGLCAEEAYLQQELEKLHDLRNKLFQMCASIWNKGQHEVLASGPIEDLIAHREHRYRISGSSLLAAMDESTQLSSGDLDKEQTDRSQLKLNRENANENINSSDEKTDRSGRGQPTVDIAEVLRRWTHALQRIHKQSLHMAKANDGEGPDLLRSANDGSTSGHAESLAATLAEHRQHLAMEKAKRVLVNQLKGVAPVIQNSISELTEEVNNISTKIPQVTHHHDNENDYFRNLKKSVREAALSTQASNTSQLEDNQSDDGSEHFFVPLSGTGFSRVGPEKKPASLRMDNRVSDGIKYNDTLDMVNEYDGVNASMSAAASSYADSEGRLSFYDVEETYDQVFSPPFLMDASLSESFEDL
ncbi:hypothetical protein M8C21_024315, partial [Ambrosia artemisiifolia]